MLPPRAMFQWAGLSLDQPIVMGILNMTLDSFSDGGRLIEIADAVEAGVAMIKDGATIIDVGGESTRPGSMPVPPDVELNRILPVIRALVAEDFCVSVDTRNASTMAAALAAGATIINDVSGLTHDPLAADVVARHACPVVLMHSRADPATMHLSAVYEDVVSEVKSELLARVEAAVRAGIRPEQIAIDPGIGFAKQSLHSQLVLRGLPDLVCLGYPVLVGISRKGFIGGISQEPEAAKRLGGSIAAALFAVFQGVSILRVHDVRDTVQAIRVWQTLFKSGKVPLPQRQG